MKRITSLLIALTLVVTLFAACGEGKSAEDTTPEATASQPAEDTSAESTPAETDVEATDTAALSGSITFWDGSWSEPAFERILPLWEEQYPNIELNVEFQIDDGMSDKYMMALNSGTAPEVIACAMDWVSTFGNAGMLSPLDTYVERDQLDTSAYVEGAINAATIDGSLYGLPFRNETYTMFYNIDLLEEAGYSEPPKTWDEVKEIAAAVTKDDVYGYGLVGSNFGNFSFQYITMLRTNGGDILTADNTASALNSPEALQAAQLYRDLAEYAPASMLENDNLANRALFASGKVAMYMSGIYDAEEIKKINPDLNFACALIPTGNNAERKTILGGWSVAIPEHIEEKDAAWEFVKFLTSSDVAAQYSNTFTGTGVPSIAFDGMDPAIVEPNAEALQYAAALPAVPQIVGIRQAIMDNLVLTLSDSATVEDSVVALDAKVNELLAD